MHDEGIERGAFTLVALESGKIADLWVLGDVKGRVERQERNAEH